MRDRYSESLAAAMLEQLTTPNLSEADIRSYRAEHLRLTRQTSLFVEQRNGMFTQLDQTNQQIKRLQSRVLQILRDSDQV